MKKILFLLLLILNFLSALMAETKVDTQVQGDPWIKQTGYLYNMTVYAQVKKDGVLFQPNGVLLGVFKDGKCWGYAGLTAGPNNTTLYNFVVGYNTTPVSGFSLQVYDPTTSQFYSVAESLTFTNNVPLGRIIAPQIYNISSVITDNSPVVEPELFSVYPNPVESTFYVTLKSESAKEANVSLFNLQGVLVKAIYQGEVKGVKVLQVDRGDLQDGIYILKASVDGKNFIQKIIVK